MIILYSMFQANDMKEALLANLEAELGNLDRRSFPDGESYLRFHDDLQGKPVVLLDSLNDPNTKLTDFVFFAHTARALGASQVGLVSPYLSYMRQDTQFNPGEAVTSLIFAKVLSQHFDWLITVDPHLHRYAKLSEIYTIPNQVVKAAPLIASWIKDHVENPILIGPDQESKQWVAAIADDLAAPYLVLTKQRLSDTKTKIQFKGEEELQGKTPVLVDDIISSAGTMMSAVQELKRLKANAPICLGVHAVFAGDAYQKLKDTGVQSIVTTNTIKHESNSISVSEVLALAIQAQVQTGNHG